MPPKKGKGGKEADNFVLSQQSMVRPSTPNDFKIVATIKALQNYVNIETKWKNRMTEAAHSELCVKSKIQRIHQLIEQAKKGVLQAEQDLETLVDEQYAMISLDPARLSMWEKAQSDNTTRGVFSLIVLEKPAAAPANGKQPPAAAAKKAPPPPPQTLQSQKPGDDDHPAVPNPETDPSLHHLPSSFWEVRRQQRESLKNILVAYFNLPRMARERRAHQRPSTAMEMQHEVDEAIRLSTPVSELLANAEKLAQIGNNTPARNDKAGALKPGGKKEAGKPPKVAPKAAAGKSALTPEPGEGRSDSITDSEHAYLLTGDLHPADLLNLPVPRAIAPRVMNRVLHLRSRRLRLEASIEIFQNEIGPLEERLRTIQDMKSVGQYSVCAVSPLVVLTQDAEKELQQIRAAEDEAFQRTRTAPSPPTRK